MNAKYLLIFCLLLSVEGCQLTKGMEPVKPPEQKLAAEDNRQQDRGADSDRLSKEEALSVVRKDMSGNNRRPEDYNYVSCQPEELWVWRILVEAKDESSNEDALEYLVMRTGPKVVAKKSLPLTVTANATNETPSAVNNRQEAITLARKNASKIHPSLKQFKIVVGEMKTVWRVVFTLEDSTGGGPAYVIDKRTGKIIQGINYQ